MLLDEQYLNLYNRKNV